MWVIVRNSDDKFVAPGGCEFSYTKDLMKAQTYSTLEKAKADCCGDEHPVAVENLLVRPK